MVSCFLNACATKPANDDGTKVTQAAKPTSAKKRTGLFGEKGLVLFGNKKDKELNDTNLAINAMLWRASLETLSFMPLVSADPFAGVITTDWFSVPTKPNERIKAVAYILGAALTAENLDLALFQQVKNSKGQWQDREVSPETVIALENAILNKARQIRIEQMQQ